MFGLGMQELLIVGVVAVLLFGKRLPDVARSVGSSYREFRKGLQDIQSQFNVSEMTTYRPGKYSSSSTPSTSGPRHEEPDDYDQPTAPKFELPASPDERA